MYSPARFAVGPREGRGSDPTQPARKGQRHVSARIRSTDQNRWDKEVGRIGIILSTTFAATLVTATRTWFGHTVSGAGDIDADGYDDVVVSGGYSPSAGFAKVFRGSAVGINETACNTLTEASGNSLVARGAGDVNGDGTNDLIMGVGADGRAYGFYGYADTDGDGVADSIDCDPADPTIGAATPWYLDADSDTYGSTTSVTACDAPASYVATPGDCDDTDAAFHPGAPEADCTDPGDYNCDGSAGTDDTDADGYTLCDDCDDADTAVNPGAPEQCNGLDDNCDGLTDDASAVDPSTFYVDADRDGFGSAASIQACDAPTGYVVSNTDCDDTDSTIHAATTTWYPDVDGDGYGSSIGGVIACDAPDYTAADSSDCDDATPLVHPGAPELCNGIDDDCSGDIDDDAVDATAWYRDRDEDGYGLGPAYISECLQPEGRVADGTDCDDYDATVHPGADDIPDDRIDQDCDGDDATTDTGEPFDTDQTDTDIPDPRKSPGCACASVEDPGTGALGLGLLALGIVLRRRRRGPASNVTGAG